MKKSNDIVEEYITRKYGNARYPKILVTQR